MSIALAARAKLNLYLAVRARRGDGFHDIETVFHSLALADDVVLDAPDPEGGSGAGSSASDAPGIRASVSVTCDPAATVEETDNLAWRAATELAEEAGVAARTRIRISKRIPVAAGLGGGSADAAATLVGADRLWGLGWPRARLRTIAAVIGADVPFMIDGGAAIGRGRGDELEPLAAWPELLVALALPRRRLGTAGVYAGCTPDGGGPPVEGVAAAVAARSLKALAELMRNDLTEAAVCLAPEIGAALETAARTGVPALMSGSGPTVFGLSDDPERVETLLAAWREAGFTTVSSELAASGMVEG